MTVVSAFFHVERTAGSDSGVPLAIRDIDAAPYVL